MFCVFLNILQELRRIHNFDFMCQPHIESADARKIIHGSIQQPFFILPGNVFLCQWILFNKEIFCPDTELQFYIVGCAATHMEGIDTLSSVAGFIFPIFFQDFDCSNALDFEKLVMTIFNIISPDINEIRSESERLDESVPDAA